MEYCMLILLTQNRQEYSNEKEIAQDQVDDSNSEDQAENRMTLTDLFSDPRTLTQEMNKKSKTNRGNHSNQDLLWT